MATSASQSDRFALKRWTGEFADPATEHAYRLATFRHARWLNRFVFAVAAAAFIVHSATDYRLYGFSTAFFELFAQRMVVAATLLLIFPLTRLPPRIRRLDTASFALQLFISFAYFGIVLQVPAEHLHWQFTGASITTLLIVVGQYLFVANRVPFAVAAGAITTAAYFALTLGLGRLPPASLALEGLMFGIANILGVAALYQWGVLRRRQFALASEQAELNQRLESQGRHLEAVAQELAHARDDALQADRAKSEFLAYMSHELRSPMNAIIGFSEIMKREMFGRMSPPKYREYAEDIHGSATHLLSLINDILDLSKAEAGKLQFNEGAVDLAAAVEAARRLVAVRAEASHIALRAQLAPNLPALTGDERMVKQMVLNLLSNAIKFTPSRGSVIVSAGQDAAGAVFVAVADTGPGIAAADIPRILEAYGRADSAEKAATEGTGLGLTLVKAMIELHGGALEIESRPGAGSTFTLRFPPARVVLAKAA